MITVKSLNEKWQHEINTEKTNLEKSIDAILTKNYKGPGKELVIPVFAKDETIARIVESYTSKEVGWKVSYTKDYREGDFLLKFNS